MATDKSVRVENTTKGQRHLYVPTVPGAQVTEFVVPGRHDGVNGSCDIPAGVLAGLKKDPIVASYFDSGDLKEVKPGFESKSAPATEEEIAAAAAIEATRQEEAKAAAIGAANLEAARKQSEASGKGK